MSGILNILAAIKGAAAAVSDAYFNLVTLLLNTSSTNGAQNNTFLDSSTNAFTITRNGNTTQGTFTPFSQTGWSNYFGSSTYLTVSNSVFNVGTSPFTIEGWFYSPGSGTGFMSLYGISQGGGPSLKVAVYDSGDGAISFDITGSLKVKTSTSVRAAMNSGWVHIAFVRESTGSNSTKCYINGVENGTGTVNDNFTGWSNPWYIGHNAELYSNAFNGYISNFRMVLGTAVYTSAFTPSTTPLTAISGTSLLTCQSNRFLDNSTNAFALTVNGSPSVQAFSPFLPTAAYDSAVVGGSGYFDGTGDYLSAGTNSAFAFGTGDFTIECWIYLTGANVNYRGIVSTRGSSGSTSGWTLATDSAGNIYIYSGAFIVQATSAIVPNTWYHVAVCRASGTTTLYLNGVSKATSTTSRDYTDSGLAISNDPYVSGEVWQGYIAGLRLVKGTAVYTAAFTPPTTPPTAITNTSLLTNYTNAGIFDSAAKNVAETVGNAQVSTTQAKWGTTSMYFDGTGDWLLTPNGKNYINGTEPFTIEFWVYLPSTPNYWTICGGGSSSLLLTIQSLTTININPYGAGNTLSVTTSLSANTWTHIAATRDSSNRLDIWVNGVSAGNATSAQSFGSPTYYVVGAADSGGLQNMTGYLDDFRISKFCRYTTTFTPPTAAFPVQ